jgi:hypothetical protein
MVPSLGGLFKAGLGCRVVFREGKFIIVHW